MAPPTVTVHGPVDQGMALRGFPSLPPQCNYVNTKYICVAIYIKIECGGIVVSLLCVVGEIVWSSPTSAQPSDIIFFPPYNMKFLPYIAKVWSFGGGTWQPLAAQCVLFPLAHPNIQWKCRKSPNSTTSHEVTLVIVSLGKLKEYHFFAD